MKEDLGHGCKPTLDRITYDLMWARTQTAVSDDLINRIYFAFYVDSPLYIEEGDL
jgi:hypothetical protein